MKIVKHIPSFLYMLAVYNIIVFSSSGEAKSVLNHTLFEIGLISEAVLTINVSDILIILGIIALYVELLKSTRSSTASAAEHALSMIVFVLFLIEFIVVKPAGTSSFLILTLMAMTDVVAGFTVTISTARRDLFVGGNTN